MFSKSEKIQNNLHWSFHLSNHVPALGNSQCVWTSISRIFINGMLAGKFEALKRVVRMGNTTLTVLSDEKSFKCSM